MGSGAVYSGAESPSEEENETLELDKFRNFLDSRPWRPLRMVPCDWFQEDVEVAEELPFSDAVVNMEVDSLGMEVDLFGPKPSDANSVQQQMSHDGGLELPPYAGVAPRPRPLRGKRGIPRQCHWTDARR